MEDSGRRADWADCCRKDLPARRSPCGKALHVATSRYDFQMAAAGDSPAKLTGRPVSSVPRRDKLTAVSPRQLASARLR